MRNFHATLILLFFFCATSTNLLANIKDPIVAPKTTNTEKPATKTVENANSARTVVPTHSNIDCSLAIYPPTDSIKSKLYVDSVKVKYPAHLKGHYLSRQPFNNSVTPSYDLKSKYSGINQTMMDIPKL